MGVENFWETANIDATLFLDFLFVLSISIKFSVRLFLTVALRHAFLCPSVLCPLLWASQIVCGHALLWNIGFSQFYLLFVSNIVCFYNYSWHLM